MSDAGYSGKLLIDKLGFEKGESVLTINEPAWYRDHLSNSGVRDTRSLPAEWAHIFVESHTELVQLLDSLNLGDIERGLWVSWPKKSSGVQTDVTEQTLRDEILPLGWVDTKIAAIDEKWSGLKFLRRRG